LCFEGEIRRLQRPSHGSEDKSRPADTTPLLAASLRRCMINTICCIYSKIPPGDK